MQSYFVVKLVHIACAIIWLGGGFFVPWDLDEALSRGQADAEALMARVKRLVPWLIGCANAMIVTGVALLVMTTGFANAPRRILVGFALSICILLIGATVAGPAWKKIEAAVAARNLEEAKRFAPRFTMLNHLEHLLGVVTLALMVLRF